MLYLLTQIRFPIGERVTCQNSLTPYREKNYQGNQQLEISAQVVQLETAANLCAKRLDVKKPLKSGDVSHVLEKAFINQEKCGLDFALTAKNRVVSVRQLGFDSVPLVLRAPSL